MPNLSNSVTFLFAGDGSLASEGLSVFLQTKSNFLMIAECNDGASALAGIQAHSPDIAVIDAQLPDMTAAQIIEAARAGNQSTRIIVLGSSADREIADRLLALGADAYVVRNGPSRYLNDAIRYVRDGGKYLAPELTRDKPLAAGKPTADDNTKAVASLRNAVEAQAKTVARLEVAMDRAQYAIELLQQKVEQLTGGPIESPHAPQPEPAPEPNRILAGLKTKVGAFAAVVMVGILSFTLAGALRPTAEAAAVAEFSSAGSEDALKSTTTGSLHLAGWELENIERATGLMKNQQYDAAEKLCQSLLKQNPANFAASRILASALFHQNRVEESADVVRSMATPLTHPRSPQSPPLAFEY
jgi:DNA-binding NarL/FixJ family response regulator